MRNFKANDTKQLGECSFLVKIKANQRKEKEKKEKKRQSVTRSELRFMILSYSLYFC